MTIQSLSAVTDSAASKFRNTSDAELQKTFQAAVAGIFFGQLVKSLRSTVGETAYLNGGQAEKMFQQQMDQYLVEDLAEGNGGAFVDDLYQQFRIQLGLPRDRALPGIAETGRALMADPAPPRSTPGLLNRAESSESPQSSQALQALNQARSDAKPSPTADAVSGFSGLFRK
jgi:Rod binding domain-containing protein